MSEINNSLESIAEIEAKEKAERKKAAAEKRAAQAAKKKSDAATKRHSREKRMEESGAKKAKRRLLEDGLDNTDLVIHNGAHLSELQAIFHMDYRTLQKRLAKSDVKPSGMRNGAKIYYIHEVAAWVIPPKMDIEAYIRNMNPNELPKMLSKEFWAGQRSRQAYFKEEGDLWPTEKIQQCFSEIVQAVVMNARVVQDKVNRQVELSTRQRELVNECVDSLVNQVRVTVADYFKKRQADNDDVLADENDGF